MVYTALNSEFDTVSCHFKNCFEAAKDIKVLSWGISPETESEKENYEERGKGPRTALIFANLKTKRRKMRIRSQCKKTP